jgi:hypothetical protein
VFAQGKEAFELILNSELTSADFFQTDKGVFGFFNKYAQGEFPTNPKGNSYVLKSINEDKWVGGKASNSASIAMDKISNQLSYHFKNILAIWEHDGKDYYLAKLLLKNFYSFILLADLHRRLSP